jgi:hypothetical protein
MTIVALFLSTILEIVNINEATTILNHQNKTPYTDPEIKEIINLLEVLSEMICDNLTKSDTL